MRRLLQPLGISYWVFIRGNGVAWCSAATALSKKSLFVSPHLSHMARTSDARCVVGAIDHAKAIRVTNLAECARRYDSKKKRKSY